MIDYVARVAVKQMPLVVYVISGFINNKVHSLRIMSFSPLFLALKSYWYFNIMQELEVIGLTFISMLMLLRFFFRIDTSVSKFPIIFWKNSSLFFNISLSMGSTSLDLLEDSPVMLRLLLALLYVNLVEACICFFTNCSKSLIFGILIISSCNCLISSFWVRIWS